MNAPKTLNLKPGRPGLVVRDPVSKVKLAPDGARVPNNQYWVRRLLCGDAIPADEQPNEWICNLLGRKPAIQVDEPAPEPIKSHVKASTTKAED